MVSTSAASIRFLQFCIQWSSIALLYYDYVLTFGMEVKYIWKERFRISTILYICCRYALVANVVYLLTISNKITGKVCRAGFLVTSSLSVFGRAAVVIVWTMRTYAVFGKSRWVLTFFGIIGLMLLILDIICIMEVPGSSCKGSLKVPIVGGLLSIMMCVFEILSAGLTTFRIIQALNVDGPWWKQKRGFNYLIFEQGILVTVITVASLGFNVGSFLQRLLNAHTMPLSGLMTARFLLHLRKWEAKRSVFQTSGINGGHEHETGTSTNIDFASNPAGSDTLNSRVNSELSETEIEPEAHTMSFMDEFGEDPVRRARGRGSPSIDLGTRGRIMEEVRR
ncbi:hypothetical protein FPV67DRAFT_1485467 [Lyophyllum atratum]|nr:hypothetical protein FPV67DRAFT_1485467 [Lyophyllum atratum]